jgi:predicted MPP superfamily phosphohydrolase
VDLLLSPDWDLFGSD